MNVNMSSPPRIASLTSVAWFCTGQSSSNPLDTLMLFGVGIKLFRSQPEIFFFLMNDFTSVWNHLLVSFYSWHGLSGLQATCTWLKPIQSWLPQLYTLPVWGHSSESSSISVPLHTNAWEYLNLLSLCMHECVHTSCLLSVYQNLAMLSMQIGVYRTSNFIQF